ncbi:hypothetical protein [Ilumatobacter nonamiensis]|nr:hypothetical protein [Ilumatobacter nonamiensis]
MNDHPAGRQAGDGPPSIPNRTLHYVTLVVLALIVVALIAVMR